MDEQITAMIKELKKDYTDRDAKNIDYIMDVLFKGSRDTLIIGTCNNEWCFTDKDKRELFLGDWKYWKNVLIDENDYKVTDFGRYKLVEIIAGLENTFTDSEERFKNYYDSVKEAADNCSSSYECACNIEWILSHLLHSRSENTRKYIWKLNINLILEQVGSSYVCRLIDFSLPISIDTPDVRVDVPGEMKDYYYRECNEINEYINTHGENLKVSVKLQNVIQQKLDLLDHGISLDRLIVKGSGNSFYFCGSGLIHRHLEAEEEMAKILNRVKNDEYSGETKDILFKIRRDIAYVNKEVSIGHDPLIPFRCIGIADYDGHSFNIQSLKTMLPNYWYLEQKNN